MYNENINAYGKKRILIISAEAWRDEDNGGNVLSNLFAPLSNEFEFAQIYCSPATPNNTVCTKYFHLSELQMLHSVFRFRKFGNFYQTSINKNRGGASQINNNAQQKYKRFKWQILYFMRELLWYISRWRTKELKNFIKEFDPDIIFAPMYGGCFMHFIDRYVFKVAHKKVISYVSDDHLTFRQYSWSPMFWLYRIFLRYEVKKTANFYSLLYTMTQEQLEEYEPILRVPMKILKKAKDFSQPTFQQQVHTPIRIIYGGNLSGNRTRTLEAIRVALSHINNKQITAQLYVYTQTFITSDIQKRLHDGKNSYLMGKVSMDELYKQYQASDILLHVESFERQPRLLTRLSFSTKIIDLMYACRCIVAVCWEESSPYRYLYNNDIAFCISAENEIEEKLAFLLKHPDLINEYAKKVWYYGSEHHQTKQVQKDIYDDFVSVLNSSI